VKDDDNKVQLQHLVQHQLFTDLQLAETDMNNSAIIKFSEELKNKKLDMGLNPRNKLTNYSINSLIMVDLKNDPNKIGDLKIQKVIKQAAINPEFLMESSTNIDLLPNADINPDELPEANEVEKDILLPRSLTYDLIEDKKFI
jgi:hypothetical protein